MQPHHGIVRSDSEFASELSDWSSIDHHSPENARVLRPQLLSLGQRARAVDAVVLERGELQPIDANGPRCALSQLVYEHVAYNPTEPCFRSARILDLICTLERPRERVMDDLLRIHLRARLLTDTAALAVSVEPAGGSPTGAPTGPIVSLGRLQI